ncbi:RNA-binding protein 7 isoform X2 [Sphaerodactylus townsendi]|uniref:RNA-binding protein 7 n=1 Tax=Sphaerodactylus townsendi TaxID=933632 RepID=A0ACB8EYT5_9SAUR|nr:RNA-binding protein 7 isoform X2 [Sphaerodactylus townsendi]
MGAAAAEADRTLFVGNLDPRVTEELLFELFHQAGPVIKVKIPKDRDGKQKLFAFVNFKHEESVPYGMNLLTGIKLFGRPLKIQFRSGSSHASQDGGSPYSQHGSVNGSPSGTPQLTPGCNRYERTVESMPAGLPAMQRSFSSPDNLQRQAVMNSALWQQQPQYSGRHGSPHSEPSGFASPGHQQSYSYSQSSASQKQWRPEGVSAQRKTRVGSHPYQSDSWHYGREHQRASDCGSEHHFRSTRDEYCHDDRNYGGWSHDYDSRRESSKESKWHSRY